METPEGAAPPRPVPQARTASPPPELDDEEAQALAFMDPEFQLSSPQAPSRPAQASAVVIPVPAASRPHGGESRSIDDTLEALDELPKTATVAPSSRPELTLEEIDAAANAAATAKAAPSASAAPTPSPPATPSPSPAPGPVPPVLTLEDREVDRVLASGSTKAAAPAKPRASTAPAPAGAAGGYARDEPGRTRHGT